MTEYHKIDTIFACDQRGRIVRGITKIKHRDFR